MIMLDDLPPRATYIAVRSVGNSASRLTADGCITGDHLLPGG